MRRLLLLAPAIALTRCLFPSLDGLSSGDVDAAGDAPSEAAPPTYVQEVQSDAPAAWWRLGESDTSAPARDQMGLQDGTYEIPGVTLGLKGAIANDPDTAMSLDGVNGAMFAPGTIFDFGGAASFSIELWISPGAPPPADASDTLRRVVSHRSDSGYGWYLAIDAAQSVQFTRWEAGTTVAEITSPPIAQAEFAHVVLTGDGSLITLFVNGAQIASGPESTTTDTPSTYFALGSNADLDGEFLDGALDEVAIYTHALAPARVLAHDQAGIGK